MKSIFYCIGQGVDGFLKKINLKAIVVTVCLFGVFVVNVVARPEKKVVCSKELMDKYYETISGFGIASDEEQEIINKGGFPTYGEITFEALEVLFNDLNVRNKDVFVDLGCGVGKAVVYAFLNTPAKKALGVELSKTRCNSAQNVAEKIQKTQKTKRSRTLEFRCQSMLDADLSDATIVYTCSTCFSEKLMRDLVDKLSRCKKGLRVLTLKKFPDHPKFKYVKAFHLPMTWASGADVHCYTLV